MKCFYHQDKDAVAICKSCHRGVCADCSADVPPGIACRGKCEADVAALNLMLERSKTVCQKTGVAYRRNALAVLIMGVVFIGIGLLPVLVGGGCGLSLIVVPFGCVFLLMAFFNYRSGKQISNVEPQGK